jgi:SAM-dependent methyltransferase
MDSTQRFTNRVDNYVKFRPGYPTQILRFLEEDHGFNAGWVVADIGSGTGISTALFLENGNTVYGVEPNHAMRLKAEELLHQYIAAPRFISIDGKAEQTGLASSSINLIIAGQAFHWFNPGAAKIEFSRISRKDGIIALLWNERKIETGLEKDYEMLLREYGSDYTTVNHKNITASEIAAFFHPQPFRLQVTGNDQTFHWEGLKGRLLSSSYIPGENSPAYPAMMRKLEDIFHKYQQDGKVTIGYETKLYTGSPAPDPFL